MFNYITEILNRVEVKIKDNVSQPFMDDSLLEKWEEYKDSVENCGDEKAYPPAISNEEILVDFAQFLIHGTIE